MKRDRIGGVPYEAKRIGGNLSLRFFPKGDSAQNPDKIVFVLRLDSEDRKRLAEIINK